MTSIAGVRADELAELTCDRRAARYREIVAWRAAVDAGDWRTAGSYRSPSAWMAAATGEPVRACARTLHLGDRLQVMPHIADLFRLGLVSEAAVSLAVDAWHPTTADGFERDELLIADWMQRYPYGEARTPIEGWAATERRNSVEERERHEFESRPTGQFHELSRPRLDLLTRPDRLHLV